MTKRLVSHDDEKLGSGLPNVIEDGIIDLIRNNSPEQGSSVALVTTEEEFNTFKSEAIDGDMAVLDIENRPNAIYIHDGTPEGYVKEFASAITRYEEQGGQDSWASFAKEGDIAIGTMGGNTYLTQRGPTSSNRYNVQLTGGGVTSGEVTDAITPDEKLGDRVVKTSEDGFLYVPTPTRDFHSAHKKYVDDAISGLDISAFNNYSDKVDGVENVSVSGVRVEKLVIVSVSFYGSSQGQGGAMIGAIPVGFRPKLGARASSLDSTGSTTRVLGMVYAADDGTLEITKLAFSGTTTVTLTWTV